MPLTGAAYSIAGECTEGSVPAIEPDCVEQ